MALIYTIGRFALKLFENIGDFLLFLGHVLFHMFTPRIYWKNTLIQIMEIGFYSLPIVATTALFSGMVLTLQIHTGFSEYSAEGAMATIIALAITRELGPVFAGLMVTARCASSMAAEIGTMRVSDQIDALTTLSVNPMKYLIAPRVWASIITMPLLVIVADLIGIFGGYLVGIEMLGFNPGTYLHKTVMAVSISDITSGMTKAAVFGMVIALVATFFGMKTKQGARGVGIATTNTVVVSSILILLLNYVMTDLFFS